MAFVTIIAKDVLGRLASFASQEVCLAWGAQLELTKLNETLSTINLVLADAEKKQVRNPLITHWLRNLKDVCHDVDDVLDELEFQKLQLKVEANNCGKIKGKVRHFFSHWNPLVFNFKVGHKVKEIRERLEQIDNDKRQYSLIEVSQLRAEDHRALRREHDDRRITTSTVEASSVIGRNGDKQQILKHLLDGTCEDNVSVISIVGLGGLGKTTLAKLVYNESTIEENFETSKMWICVSDQFDIRTLVRGIIRAAGVPKYEGDDSLDIMEKKLQDTLRGKKFLLVLDDVWDTESIGVTREKWITLKTLLDVGAKGSKIIITTRNTSVVLVVESSYTHCLRGLPHEDCMSLFIQRAFKKGEEHRYPHLKEIGEDIVNKCGGVPLAVAAIGSMLYSNTEQHHWLSVRDDEKWSIRNDDILPALKLSYDALPHHLKPCFAFCSLFSKDFIFESKTLVQLWMAQGYLKSSKKNEDLIQMGIDYIRQFCSRSLFEEEDFKTVIRFKIHDLVHDLAISVAQVEYSTVNSRPSSAFEPLVRHVSISKKGLLRQEAEVPDFIFKSTKLRTFLIPEKDGKMNQRFVKTCISSFKFLRVLDLSGSLLEELPNSIGSLFHLRFLDLSSNDKIKRLPNSICQLLKLESFIFCGCTALEEIPKDIGNLSYLRSLMMTTQQTYLPKGIRRLTLLQVFLLDSCVNLKSLGEEIQFLSNLRQLWILRCKRLECLPTNMKLLKALDTLVIDECEQLDLMKTKEGPQGLTLFGINYSDLKALPPWLEDSAKHLRSIAIGNFDNLTQLSDLQKFTFLEQLEIEDCPNLLALPQGLLCLSEFRELEIGGCPKLIKSCKRQFKGEDWSKFVREAKIKLDSDVDTDEEEEEDEGTPMINQADGDAEAAFHDHNAISSDN